MQLLGSPRRMPSMTGYGLEVTGFVGADGRLDRRDGAPMQDADKGQTAGDLDGADLRIGIVQARFNDAITDALAEACIAELQRARRRRRAHPPRHRAGRARSRRSR